MEYIHKFQVKSLSERKQESLAILTKYPDRIPVILDRRASHDPKVIKSKYLAPRDLTLTQFKNMLRSKHYVDASLRPEEALYMFAYRKIEPDKSKQESFRSYEKSDLPPPSWTFSQLYGEYANADGYLMLVITRETTFGADKAIFGSK